DRHTRQCGHHPEAQRHMFGHALVKDIPRVQTEPRPHHHGHGEPVQPQARVQRDQPTHHRTSIAGNWTCIPYPVADLWLLRRNPVADGSASRSARGPELGSTECRPFPIPRTDFRCHIPTARFSSHRTSPPIASKSVTTPISTIRTP